MTGISLGTTQFAAYDHKILLTTAAEEPAPCDSMDFSAELAGPDTYEPASPFRQLDLGLATKVTRRALPWNRGGARALSTTLGASA